MKILVLTDRFVPEVAAASVRTMAHAQVWLKEGHEVTVATCSPNFPRGIVFDGYKNRLYQEEWLHGVRVLRLWSYMAANEGVLKRSLDYVSYMASAILQCPRFPDFDVLLATSPPIFVAMAGYAVAKLRRRPWVFEIRDLWPASIKAVGAGKGRALRLVEKLELFLYRKANRIVSLTHSFKHDLTSRAIPGEKIDVVLNGVDTEQFNRNQLASNAREALGVDARTFLAGYIGTTGMAHGLETVLDAAQRCKDRSDIQFLIMGEGAERAKLETEARSRQLTNLMFRDFVPHEKVPEYLAALDASIVHLRPDPLFKTVIPSKIFENMAMSVPMIMAVEGEAAGIVAESGSGICIPSGDADAMCQAILRLSADRQIGEEMGRNGWQAVRQKYGRKAGGLAVLSSLEKAIEDYGARRPSGITMSAAQSPESLSDVTNTSRRVEQLSQI